MNKIPSIFNDVLSPVTPGPSSSNTCGPHRIASLCRRLLGEEPRSFVIDMAEDGGYPDTFFGMQSDLAFIAGILGRPLLTYDLTNAYADAEASGLTLSFNFVSSLPGDPSELAEITVTGRTRTLRVTGISLGGGEIQIARINGKAAELDGKERLFAVWRGDAPKLFGEGDALPVGAEVLVVDPVFPFRIRRDGKPPFSTAEKLFALAKKRATPLWKLAFQYETELTGAAEGELRAYAEKLYDLCLASTKRGAEGAPDFKGVTKPKAAAYKEALRRGELLPLGLGDRGCLDALSIMEYSNAHGKIVCMPTGGSSGVIPAAIRSAAESLNRSRDEQINALMTAGLIGLFYYPTHYSGALGCQAEIGVAISMAAAALASLLTDDPDTVERAASLGGQSVMGLLCNPIDGFVQVPCILRNMAAVPIAATCANAAFAGLDSVIPLDAVVQLMLDVGKKLKPCNRAGTYTKRPPSI